MIKLVMIEAFGFELEGGWKRDRYDDYRQQGIMKGDGSVSTNQQNGEIASRPFKIVENAAKFITEYYPDETNDSCGFHIHISVSDKNYQKLMEKDFYDEFFKWAEKWGKKNEKILPRGYFSRLSGENRFCQKKYDPLPQILNAGDRYTALNYCHAKHGTMENRVFPAPKEASTAVKMLTDYLLFVDGYLKNTRQKKTVPVKFEIEYEELETKLVKL